MDQGTTIDIDGPGVYAWRNALADRALEDLIGNRGLHVVKLGKAVRLSDRADEGAYGEPTPRSRSRYTPRIYASLPGWTPWRCAPWDERQTLRNQELDLQARFTSITREQRLRLYERLAPHVREIPPGVEIFLANFGDLASLLPYNATDGVFAEAANGQRYDTKSSQLRPQLDRNGCRLGQGRKKLVGHSAAR